MSTLHFGFEEYTYPDGMTTVQVANILEAEYHVVEHFRDFYQDQISELLHEALADSLETSNIDLSKIEELFRQFLDDRTIEKLGIPGVPTAASRAVVRVKEHTRVNIKVRSYLRPGKSIRPSFVHTGLYRDAFKVWLERN